MSKPSRAPILACSICRAPQPRADLMERRAGANRIVRYCRECWQAREAALTKREMRT